MAYLMLVDDDQDFAEAAATALRAGGHEVEIALDTDSAAGQMEERKPDLVILDVMFPEDSDAGFKLARSMQVQSSKLKGIPILMLTAVNEKTPIKFSARDIDETWLPVADFLEKPVELAVLQKKVSDLLAKTG